MDIWAPLSEGTAPRTYSAGQLIYLQGTEPVEFYYLVKGRVRSFISSPEGGERALTIHTAGDLMGEASFFDERPRVSSAVALEDCLVTAVDRSRLTAVFAKDPDLAFHMCQYLARTVRLLSGHVDDITFRPAEQRIARWLLSHGNAASPLTCTHEEIGLAVGTSRVTVSRVLSSFSRQGLLKTGYGSIQILDLAGLTILAKD